MSKYSKTIFLLSVLFLYNHSFANLSPYSVTLKQIDEIDLPSKPIDISIKEGYAYIVISSGTSGSIISLDISVPDNIPLYKFYDRLAENPVLIALYGYYGYIAESNGIIRIINFKNINTPFADGSFDTFSKVKKMVVRNGYLYYIREDFGLHIFDISTPNVPILKGNQIVTGEANGLFVNNKYAFVTSITGNLTIIDITNLSNLPVAGSYNFGINFYDVYVSDNYAYIPQGETGVQVININKLPTPEWVTNIFSRKFSKQVVVSSYYTWVNDENSIQAFYNRDPKSQLYAGSFDNMGAVINKIEVVDGKYIFLCSNNKKLKVIQIIYNY